MNEENSFIPNLTLDPMADTAAAVQEAPAEKKEEEVVAQKLDISSLSPAEQAAVRSFSEKIDVLNTEQVMNYGSAAQKNITEFSDAALKTVRTKDLGEVGEQLGNLVVELKGFNFERGEEGLLRPVQEGPPEHRRAEGAVRQGRGQCRQDSRGA